MLFSIKKFIIVAFVVAFVGSFAYLFVTQKFAKPPSANQPVNTDIPSSEYKPGAAPTLDAIVASKASIKKFASKEDFEAFLAEQSGSRSYGYAGDVMMKMGESSVAPAAPGGVSADFPQEFAGFSEQDLGRGGGGGDYSQTNIQVEGVDEADIVKSDGKYLYALSNNNLFIVDAYPAGSASVVTKIEFKSQPQNIFINGDRLVIFGYDYNIRETELYKTRCMSTIRCVWPNSQFTFFKVFDITDRKNPKQVRDLDIEGGYLNARMIGDYVYLLTSKYSYQILDGASALPVVIEGGSRIVNDPDAPGYVFPNVYYFDIVYNGYNMTTVHAINVKDSSAAPTGETYVVDPDQKLYVSPENLYMAFTKRVSEEVIIFSVVKDMLLPRLSERDRARIAEIESVPNYILSPEEKFAKISPFLERLQTALSDEEQKKLEEELKAKVQEKYSQIRKEIEKTIIHKIGVDKGKLAYRGTGEVPGYVLNQYSMDERDGYFRIATTQSRTWSAWDDDTTDANESYSNVYVLDGSLQTVGALENLAKGEQIFSARFMGKRVYLVTFRQTDPFFAIDLSDPRNPRVLGQLKIPGFSNYLHPYDDTTIIGLGRDAVENEWGGATQKGIKISLFDVSDVANPREVTSYVDSDPTTSSLALTDPKAFLFSRAKDLLVIPVTSYNSPEPVPLLEPGAPSRILPPQPRRYFNGAYVFTITKNSIALKGKISHDFAAAYDSNRYYGGSSAQVKRGLYIKEILYTLSDLAIKMNKLEDLADVKNLELKKEPKPEDDFTITN